MMNQSSKTEKKVDRENWLLILAVISLSMIPLIFIKGDFQGADGKAEEIIKEIQPSYQPWADNILSPPSSEVESLLFASQAAFGAGIIGFTIGFYKGRKREE